MILHECSLVVREGPILAHSPNIPIQRIKIVPEPQLKLATGHIVIVCFHIVDARVERHLLRAEAVAPVPPWHPEVDEEELLLVHFSHVCLATCRSPHLSPINRPCDVVWRPGELVIMPGRR